MRALLLALLLAAVAASAASATPTRYVYSATAPEWQSLVSARVAALQHDAEVRFSSEKTEIVLDSSQADRLQKLMTRVGEVVLVDSQGETFAPQWASAEIQRDQGTYESLLASMIPEQREQLESWTADRVGTTVEIRLDGEVFMAPKVMEAIGEGALVLSGAFGQETDLRLLQIYLTTGPLRDPLRQH